MSRRARARWACVSSSPTQSHEFQMTTFVHTKVLSHAAKTSAGRYALTNKDRVPAQFLLNQIRRRYTSYTQHSFTCTVCLFMIVSRSRLFNVRTMFDFVVRLLILIKTTSFLGLKQVHLPHIHKTSETHLKI